MTSVSLIGLASTLCACQVFDLPPTSKGVAPPVMEMTTNIPDVIATPDPLDPRIGALTAFDGVPDAEMTERIYENVDFHHGLQAFLNEIQIASIGSMRKRLLEFEPANTTTVPFKDLMDSKALWLTPNATSVYMASWLQLTDEPWVIETPPDVLGIIDDA